MFKIDSKLPVLLCLGSLLAIPGCDSGTTDTQASADKPAATPIAETADGASSDQAETSADDAAANAGNSLASGGNSLASGGNSLASGGNALASGGNSRPAGNPAPAGNGNDSVGTANAGSAPATRNASGPGLGTSGGNGAPTMSAQGGDKASGTATAGNAASRPERAAPAPDMSRFVVTIEPASLDFGEIATEDSGTGTVMFTNTGDTPRQLIEAKASCGCTAVDFPKGKMLEPGETVEVAMNLKAGQRPRVLNKTVTFLVDGQDPIVMPIRGEAVSYVTMSPEKLDPETHSDGAFVLTSRDGEPFRITSMHPPVITDFSEEAQANHELSFDWAKWEELGSRRKLLFYLDHSKCVRLYADVNVQLAQTETVGNNNPGAKNLNTGLNQGPPKPLDPMRMAERQIKAGAVASLIKQVEEGTLDVDATDRTGNTLLCIASKYGNLELMDALLIEGADVEAQGQLGRTPIMFAAQSKDVEAIQMLIDEGANIMQRDDIGGTPLTWAAGIGDAASVELLVDAGCDINAAGTITGFTPLIWAALSGEPSSVQLLLDKGADVDTPDYLEGATPLMHAVRTGKNESVQILIDAGASLDETDKTGRSVLLMAASSSGARADTVQLLVDAGSDIGAEDRRGLNALDLARKRTDARAADVIALLTELLGDGE